MVHIIPKLVLVSCLVIGIVSGQLIRPIDHLTRRVMGVARFASDTIGGGFMHTTPPAFELEVGPNEYLYAVNFVANFRHVIGIRSCSALVEFGGSFRNLRNYQCNPPRGAGF